MKLTRTIHIHTTDAALCVAPIDALPHPSRLPLSFTQQRLWFPTSGGCERGLFHHHHRERIGREPSASATVIDRSQGFDAGKKVKYRKRRAIIDTETRVLSGSRLQQQITCERA
ncbi:hypothetical protein [Mesorhizobium sp. M0228]|uniref:hypothetical protein n=1 Tax=Mesorhizobium sp. M0228 TaxID=2956923 RepID=UPI00333C4DB7